MIDIEDALFNLIVKFEQKKALEEKKDQENQSGAANKGKSSGRPVDKRRSTPYEIQLPEKQQKEGGSAEAT